MESVEPADPALRDAGRPHRTRVRGGRLRVPGPRACPPRPGGARSRRWRPSGPLDLGLTLGPLRHGPADPAFRVTPDGSVWLARRTPAGPGTLRVLLRREAGQSGEAEAEAWGPGADWLLETLPALLGAEDDPGAFTPRHRLLEQAHRRHPGLRLTRSGLVLESLVPAVLEQRVTTGEAFRAWRLLLLRYGEPAPGPLERLHVMPDPRGWALIPSWEWHRAGVDGKRSAAILRAVRVARRLQEAAAMDPAAAAARLRLIPGVGPWTAAETLQRSNGAADALSVGDLNLPGIVGYALAGRRGTDDAGMLELLAPYAGQRHRACRLILLTGRTPPRRTPRARVHDIRAL